MNFQVFKIFEKVNNYYYYIISHIANEDLNLDIAESWASEEQENPINTYLSVIGFDNVDIQKCSDISPIQVINRSFPSDTKNMNVSDEFKTVLQEALKKLQEAKKPRAKKAKDPNEAPKPKKEPKPRAKKSTTTGKVQIDMNSKPVSFD